MLCSLTNMLGILSSPLFLPRDATDVHESRILDAVILSVSLVSIDQIHAKCCQAVEEIVLDLEDFFADQADLDLDKYRCPKNNAASGKVGYMQFACYTISAILQAMRTKALCSFLWYI